MKEKIITALSILKCPADKIHSVKSILIRTSSGKERPYTLPETGFNA